MGYILRRIRLPAVLSLLLMLSFDPFLSATAQTTASCADLDAWPLYAPCVPQVGYDLDCGCIAFGVQGVGFDIHGIDREGDWIGANSYG